MTPAARGAATASPDPMALTSLICGLVAIPVWAIPFEMSWLAPVLSLLAVIFAAVAFGRIGRDAASGRGMAVTGLITGLLGLVAFAIAVIGLFVIAQGQR